jgi:hypothetical protein
MREQFATVVCKTCDTNYRGAVKEECKEHDVILGTTSLPEGLLKGKVAGFLAGLCYKPDNK